MIVRELITRLGYDVDDKGAEQYDKQLGSLKAKAAVVVAALAAAAAVVVKVASVVAQAGDAMTRSLALIEGAIGRSATSAAEAAGVYEDLYALSLQTGVSADESASAFARFNLALRNIGRPASDTVDLIAGLQAAAINAGVGTQELTGAMVQLGQALASGRLQGDEFRTLRENMPAFLHDVARELNITMAELMEQAEKGLLTSARLVPAMLAASRAARTELARAPLTMARSWAILGNATTRFLADIDKALQLSQILAHMFRRAAEGVDWLRRKLAPVGRALKAVVDQLGGAEAVSRTVMFGLAGLAAILTPLIVSLGIAAAHVVALGAALFAMWAVAEDFYLWVTGADLDTLFGSLFGDFDTAVAQPFIAAWNAIRDGVVNAIATIIAEWERFWASDQVGLLTAALTAGAAAIMAAWEPVRAFFVQLWEDVVGAFDGAIARLQPVIDWLRDAARWLNDPWGSRGPEAPAQGAPAPSAPVPGAPRRGALGGRGAALGGDPLSALRDGGIGGVEPSAGLIDRLPGPGWGNINQEALVNIVQNINATGNDPASIAAAARSGAGAATRATVRELDGAFARGLAAVAPRWEPATQ